jgi:hypothetical protein
VHTVLTWVLRVLLAVVLMPVLALAGYAGWNWLRLTEDPVFVAYLQKNASHVDLNSPISLRLTQADLENRLFLLGEVHGIAIGQELDFALFRSLNELRGVRIYTGEFDVAQAAKFNAYLRDGDEAHMRRVFQFWFEQHAQWANKDYMQKLRRIREWNATLPPGRKVMFKGADRVQDMPLMAQHLMAILSRLPENSWPGHATLMSALENPASQTENSPDAPLPAAAVEARKTLPPSAPTGVDIGAWNELVEAVSTLADRAQLRGREAVIVAAFERLATNPEFENEKFYGLWGQFHVLDAIVEGEKPLVRQLNEGNSPLKERILNLSLVYTSSEMMMPSLILPESVRPKDRYFALPYSLDGTILINVNGINDLTAAAKGPLSMFKMNASGSPYPGTNRLGDAGGLLALMQPFRVDPASTRPRGAVKYTLLAKGSPATAQLRATDVALN